MVRLLVLYNPPEDAAAFDKYYNEIHAPLTKQLPGLLRYTVSKSLAVNAQYYLVAELDWEDRAAARSALSSPIGAECSADMAKFATTGAVSMLFEVAEL